ncbi:hypothetical protein IKD67_01800 [Candidatus Saccharibacteria bacterium]|nr:hypothetical protein [Candidatus Saccharibacteria bacterium]
MKKQNTKNNYKTPCIVLGCVVVALVGALIYCCANIKSAEDKEYLALQDHLLSRFVKLNYQKDNQVCEMESHSLSKDNEVSVRFWCQNYDADTHEPSGSKEYHTLYFQHPSEFAGGKGGYAEALGD